MVLADFSGSRDTSVGSLEGFGGFSRKFLYPYTLKVSIKHIFTGGNDPQHLTAPEIVVKISETPSSKITDFMAGKKIHSYILL